MGEHPRIRPTDPRPLSAREKSWIQEILESNPKWADVDPSGTQIVAECDCGSCSSVYLGSASPQNPSLAQTRGYIGRIEIVTTDDFMITVTLDQRDGALYELYVNQLDTGEPGTRRLPDHWQEKGHTVICM